jgi:hypothetical protein
MAWTAPTTRTTDTLITAAIWNTDIEDNLTWLGASHDHNGGSGDGATLGLVASGFIAMFDVACPSGWTRVSAWDGKFLRGAAAYGGTGGSDTHTHSIASGHTHSITDHTHSAGHTHSIPAHTHSANHAHNSQTHTHYGVTAGSGNTTAGNAYNASATVSTDSQGSGTSGSGGGTSASGGAGTSGSGGTGTSDAGSSVPAYINVVFCKKD